MEVFQKFSDKPLSVHPSCGGQLQKVFHPSGVVFKGSGYYVTDSRSKSSASRGSNGSNGSSSSKSDKPEGSKKTETTTSSSPSSSEGAD